MQIQSLGWEDPLEKEMATHPSIPAWEVPWTEEPGGLQVMELQRVGQGWVTNNPTQPGLPFTLICNYGKVNLSDYDYFFIFKHSFILVTELTILKYEGRNPSFKPR